MELKKEKFDILVAEKLKENRSKNLEPKNITINSKKIIEDCLNNI